MKPTGFSISQDKLYISINNGEIKVIELDTGKIVQDVKVSKNFLSRPIIYNKNLFVIKNGSIVQYE